MPVIHRAERKQAIKRDVCACVYAKSLQSCLTLCDPMDCSPPRLLCPWDSLGKDTGEGCYALLQGIILTQGWNLGFLHFRQIFYHLSCQGSPTLINLIIINSSALKRDS